MKTSETKAATYLTILVVAVAQAACGESPSDPADDSIRLPRELTVSEISVLEASNVFAFGLLAELAAAKADSNVFLSPLSATMALGMTMNGAAGNTLDEMRQTLGFGDLPQAEINAAYRGLLDLLVDLDPEVEVQLANSIWYRLGFPVEQPFLDATRGFFDAEVQGLDFDDPGSADVINRWVDQATRGKIPTIVDPPIDPLTMLFLINAVYFKGTWTYEFDPDDTQDAAFHRADGSTGTVKLMHLRADLPFTENEGFQVVDLPYGGAAYSMTVLLPRQGVDLATVVAGMDDTAWREVVGALTETTGTIELPRFRLEWESLLNSALWTLGMRDAFDPDAADFTGISDRAREMQLHVRRVKQKTFVEVNEEGTEAAAVTSVEVGITSCCPDSGFHVRVDRPFLVAIRERLSGTILFVGAIYDPPSS